MAAYVTKFFDVVTSKNFFHEFNLEEGPIIGRGYSSTVIRASFIDDPTSNHAVKIFSLQGEDSSSHTEDRIIKNFYREVQVMKKAAHPRIMPVIATAMTPTSLALVLPYYRNGSLMSSLETLTRNQQRKYTTQVIQAVRYLHDKNIVHLDIKPDNIMIDDEDNIILSDFGFSRQVSNKNVKLLITYGTKNYIAPETGHDQRVCPFKVDVFALGVTLCCILLKKLPHHSENLMEELNNTTDIPEVIRMLISSMLDIDPMKRPMFAELP